MTLRLNGSTSGYVEIEAPAAAGSNTLVLPTGNGTSGQVLSTNGSGALSFVDRMTAAGPAFSAGGTTQALTNAVQTKVICDTENFDTASCYDSSTSRFTPTVAGYYFISVEAQFTGVTSSGFFTLYLSKNGTLQELSVTAAPVQYIRTDAQFLYYLDGSTDYVEFYAYQNSGGARNIGSTFFQGFLARPA